MKDRVCIFVDGSNLYHSLKNLKVDRINFQKLIKVLVGDYMFISLFYYTASMDINFNPEKYWKHQKFLEMLREIPGINVVLCNLRKSKRNGKVIYDLKGDDVNLAVDLVSGAYENLYDNAIILSGDEDFIPAIKRVQKLKKKVINAYFKKSSSAALKKSCNDSIYMNELIENIK